MATPRYCINVYLFFILGVLEIGHNHFWLCAVNLSTSFAIRKLLGAKRPVEYNRALMPITDIAAESYGLPSLESHMSVVVMGHLFMHFKSILFAPIALIIVFIVGFSRLYSKSRFVHQVIVSWISGVFGLFVGLSICRKINFDSMLRHHYVFFSLMCGGGFLCHFMLCVENNDSRIYATPRREFIRVLTEIINPPPETQESVLPDDEDQINDEEGEDGGRSVKLRVLDEDDSRAIRQRKINSAKRDSFYFLQRSLERRANGGVLPIDPSPTRPGRNNNRANGGIETFA